MSRVVINAGDNGSWVRKFVLLESTIQSFLNDFFVGQVGDFLSSMEHVVKEGSSIISSFLVLLRLPKVILVAKPFMQRQEVKSSIGDESFLNVELRSCTCNSVFSSKCLSFFVLVKTMFHTFWQVIVELLCFRDGVNQLLN